MRIGTDPTIVMRQTLKDRITTAFNNTATPHLDAAYARKKAVAASIKQGGSVPEDITSEAALSGITVDQLCDKILAKPDHIASRELDRQKKLADVDKLTVEELLARVNVNG